MPAVMIVLGAQCSADTVHFAKIIDGALDDTTPRRYQLPSSLGPGPQLVAMFDYFVGEVGRVRPDVIGLFVPTYPPSHQPSYPQARERARVETILELAAAQKKVELVIISGAKVRSMFGIGRGGSVADTISTALKMSSAPMYWRAGRAEAAAAGLAVTK